MRLGVMRRPVQGVYVPSSLPDSLDLRIDCLRLVLPDDAFACDETAAWLHAGEGALPPGADLEGHVPIFFRPGDGGRVRNTLCDSGRRTVLEGDLVELGGLVSTTPLRTALDLGRLRHADRALWGIDLMLRAGGVGREEVIAALPRFRGARGVVQLRELATWADAGSESFGESALRLRYKYAGLPRPETQIELAGEGRVVFLDMGLPDLLVGAEYDGEEWHGEDRADHDAERRAWVRETHGFEVDVFCRPNVFGQHQRAEFALRASYERARRALPDKRHFVLARRASA